MPGRRTTDLALHHGRERADTQPILVQQLWHLRNEGQMHPQQATPHHPLGTRGGDRGHARRLDEMPNAMRVRRSIVEHVFGTIKDWMGRGHFLTRKLANVATEMSLHVLAYNVKRAVAVLGTPALMAAIRG